MNNNIARDSSKGLRSYSVTSTYVDLSSLSNSDISDLMKKLGKETVNLSHKAQALYDKYNTMELRGKLMLSVMRGTNKRFNSVTNVTKRRADTFMMQNPITIKPQTSGVSLCKPQSDEVLRECRSNVMYNPVDQVSTAEIVKKQFAVRAASMLSVKPNSEGGRSLRVDALDIPEIVKGFEIKSGAQMLRGTSCSDLDLEMPDTVYRSIDEADMENVANATTLFYNACDSAIRKHLTAVPVGKEMFYFPTSAPMSDVKLTQDEYVAKERIRTLTTAYPGVKKGPGNFVSSHMDGIPLSGSMRRKFNHVSDVVDVDADVYLVDDHDPIVINALRTLLVRGDAKKLLLYRSTKTFQNRVLRTHVEMTNNQITKIRSSCCLSGSIWPSVSPELKSCYITFRDSQIKAATNFSQIVDNARVSFNELQDLEECYTYVQCYIDYRALSFQVLKKTVDGMSLVDANSRWNVDERYYPCSRMGEGMAWYVTKSGEVGGEMMATAIATACLHRIQYMVFPMPRREFNGVAVPLQPFYNFSVESMRKRMPYVALDDESKVARFFSPEDLADMKTALSRQMRRARTGEDAEVDALLDDVAGNVTFELEEKEEEDNILPLDAVTSEKNLMNSGIKTVGGFGAINL